MTKREKVYNKVMKEYIYELPWYHGERWYLSGNKQGDNMQEIVTNLTDLVMEFGDEVFKVIKLDDYALEHLLDYEYLEIQMNDWLNDYK